jgi:tetratricopeptide (TPR) repeat protein
MEIASIIIKIKELNARGHYKATVKAITPSQLKKSNDPVLYSELANAYSNLKQFQKAVNYYTTAIKLEPNEPILYGSRGAVLYRLKRFAQAVEDFSESIKLASKDPSIFLIRANCKLELKLFDEAIEDYNSAIKLDSKSSIYPFLRAKVLLQKKDYKNAAKDFTKAIKLDNFPVAQYYYDRGTCWFNLKNYSKAIHDFTNSIRLSPQHLDSYFLRACANSLSERFEQADRDFSVVIKIKPSSLSYYFRGHINFLRKDYLGALRDYTQAIKLNPKDSEIYFRRGQLWFRRKQYNRAITDLIKAWQLNPNEKFYTFFEAAKDLPISTRKEILLQSIKLLFGFIESIRKHSSENIKRVKSVTHYTKLHVADSLLQDIYIKNDTNVGSESGSRFRFYNAVYMNDPEEGQALLNYLNNTEINKSFENGKGTEENGIYLGSFLTASVIGNNALNHDDELVMWRTYGKDERNNEAVGCSIAIDTNFFDNQREYLQFPAIEINTKKQPLNQPLYEVIYYDHRNSKFIGNKKQRTKIKKDVDGLRNSLLQLIKLKEKGSEGSKKNRAIDKIVYILLSEVRYFFKSSDYAFENELRVIQFLPSSDKNVKIDSTSLPKKLYVESNKSIQKFINKIILGPKVSHPERWLYLEAIMKKSGHPIKLEFSKQKFQ